jgi:hypothetical protein
MCSAIQPSSRAMFEAIRSAKHFFPRSALPAVARAVAPDLAGLREVDDVLLLVAGPRHVLRALLSGAPTECMHGTTRFSPLSISAKTGRPILAMIRMLTTT